MKQAVPEGTAWGARPDCLRQPDRSPQFIEKKEKPGYHRSMDYDTEKVDNMSLALLFLTSFEEYGAMKAWKGMAWEISNRLHEKGFIHDPKKK